MALERDFLSMAEGTVTWAPLSTVSSYASPVYSTETRNWPAHVEPGQRIVVGPEGKEEVAQAVVFVLSSSAAIETADRLTLPDGTQPRLLRVDVLNDEEGQHHLEVLV